MLLEPPPEESLLAAAVGFDGGVITVVTMMVATPAVPEETLVPTEVKGVADSAVTLCERDPAVGCVLEEAGADVCEGELPLPVPEAKPVMPEIVGTADAWFEPMVAYGLPSCSAKNGRGLGDS